MPIDRPLDLTKDDVVFIDFGYVVFENQWAHFKSAGNLKVYSPELLLQVVENYDKNIVWLYVYWEAG